MDAAEIGSVIRFHRKQAGLTQKECARLAGIGKTALFDVEKGKATSQLSTVLAVCDVLNMSLELAGPLMEYYLETRSS